MQTYFHFINFKNSKKYFTRILNFCCKFSCYFNSPNAKSFESVTRGSKNTLIFPILHSILLNETPSSTPATCRRDRTVAFSVYKKKDKNSSQWPNTAPPF